MARTPLAGLLENAAADLAVEAGLRTTRRELLRRGAVAGFGVAALGRLAPVARGASAPRIVIVGAGLAGLSCAYRLRQAGYVAEVYEASDRVGGRCWTGRGDFADGQLYEHGGELIDQGHNEIRNLAQELGLKLDSLLRAEVAGSKLLGWFDGEQYPVEQITDDLKPVWQQLHSDLSAASYPTLFDSSTERGRQLDSMSVAGWIEQFVPGGMRSKLGQLLDVAYTIEYGADSAEQSSLNLIYLLGYQGPGQFRVFGKSNEKYHVRGGNDQIAQRLRDLLPGQITFGAELVGIEAIGDAYRLTFRGRSPGPVVADKLVLALPFSILRRSVDLTQARFSELKREAISELGMGTNSKLHLQFGRRLWSERRLTGETYSDNGYQSTWEVSRAQPGTSGILVDYTGGTVGASFGSGTTTNHAKEFLSQIEPVLPDLTKLWNGKATLDYWPGYEWTLGSYSYWKVGQYTAFSGIEGRQEGNAHFCGEHTSINFQGYLNGAVETGERAAAEVVADLR